MHGMKINPHYKEKFESRHNGPDKQQVEEMLKVVKAASVDALVEETVPSGIRLKNKLQLPAPLSEAAFLKQFKKTISKNKLFKSFIGAGYYGTHTPGVILRNVFENPGCYPAEGNPGLYCAGFEVGFNPATNACALPIIPPAPCAGEGQVHDPFTGECEEVTDPLQYCAGFGLPYHPAFTGCGLPGTTGGNGGQIAGDNGTSTGLGFGIKDKATEAVGL